MHIDRHTEGSPHKTGRTSVLRLHLRLIPQLDVVHPERTQQPVLLLEAFRPVLIGNVQRPQRAELRFRTRQDRWAEALDVLDALGRCPEVCAGACGAVLAHILLGRAGIEADRHLDARYGGG